MDRSIFIFSTLFHVLGMSASIIGSLKQMSNPKKTITPIQFYGAFIALGSGLLLAFMQDPSTLTETGSQTKIALKLVIAITLCTTATIGIKRTNWPTGYYLASFLVMLNILIAIAWKL